MILHKTSFCAPGIGQSMSFGVSGIDPSTLVLTLAYYEYVQNGVWVHEERQLQLAEGTHYSFNAAQSTFELLDDPFWHTLGLWRAADTEDELLSRGRVKHPQQVDYSFDYWAPAQVAISTDKSQIAGGGVDPVEITATCSDPAEAEVLVSVVKDGTEIGSISLPKVGDVWQRSITSTAKGRYELRPGATAKDAQGRPRFTAASESADARVEVV